uniref:Probable serine/threonine-protein kinase MARK-A-like n=1 Tax=Saccoglossus kowalevskii TaxID=10224 RepID=A0ABM0MM78_SACKO|nr:PREDICTED: probable serine/threonine-protein kinase MARK-A-like [Saccoglossus kowalevskii]
MALQTYTYEEKYFPCASTEVEECRRHGYELTDKTLGSGAYAKVKLAYASESKIVRNAKLTNDLSRKGNSMVAIKIICRKDAPPDYINKFMPREIEALKTTYRHENLIQLYEYFRTELRIYLIMEFAASGDMLEFINNTSLKNGLGGIGEELSRRLFRQLVSGILHCHQLDVVHRDLKCENILLDEYKNIKLLSLTIGDENNCFPLLVLFMCEQHCNFGFATRIPNNKSHLLKTFCGSYAYAAPEILTATHYDGKLTDIWSLGIILFAMVNGKLPFSDNNLKSLIEQTKQKLEFKPWITNECQDLVCRLLRVKPLARLKAHEILRHPWLMKNNPRNDRIKKIRCAILQNQSNEDISIEDIEDDDEEEIDIDEYLESNGENLVTKTPSFSMFRAPRSPKKRVTNSPATNAEKTNIAHYHEFVLNSEKALRCTPILNPSHPKEKPVKMEKVVASKPKTRVIMTKLLAEKKKQASKLCDQNIMDTKAAGESFLVKNIYQKAEVKEKKEKNETEQEKLRERKRREMRRKLLGIPVLYGQYRDLLRPKTQEQLSKMIGSVKGKGPVSQSKVIGAPNQHKGSILPPLLKQKGDEANTTTFRYTYSKKNNEDVQNKNKAKTKVTLVQLKSNNSQLPSKTQDVFLNYKARQVREKQCQSVTNNSPTSKFYSNSQQIYAGSISEHGQCAKKATRKCLYQKTKVQGKFPKLYMQRAKVVVN